MSEGLKLVVGGDVRDAEKALKSLVDTTEDTADDIVTSMTKAFGKLKDEGLINLGSIEDALGQFRQALKLATDPRDVEKLNKAIVFLEKEQKKLKDSGVERHFDGVHRSTLKVATASQNLSRIFELFPKEVQHLTHVFDSLIESYEQIRSKTNTSGEAFKKLGSAFVGPLGIGIALSLGITLLEKFGGKLFEVGEEAKKTKERIAELNKLLVPVSSISAIAGAGTAGEAAQVNALAAVVGNLTKSYAERNAALNELKSINKSYFGDLTLESGSLATLKDRVKEYNAALVQQAIIKKFVDKIAEVSIAIAEQGQTIGGAAAKVKKFQRVLEATKSEKAVFSGLAAQGETDRINKAAEAVDKANKNLKEQSNVFNELIKQSGKLTAALNTAQDIALKFRPLDNKVSEQAEKAAEKAADKIIQQAQRIATFLDKTTQFSVKFEIDPQEDKADTLKKAKAFIENAKRFAETGLPPFDFKPLARIDFKFIPKENFFEEFRKRASVQSTKTFEQVKADFEKNIDQAVKRNPITINTENLLKFKEKFNARFPELANAFHIPVNFEFMGDPAANLILLNQEFKNLQANIKLANELGTALGGAFQNTFNAILQGESPIKAFIQSIGQSIIQLISQLIAAAIKAAILKAILGTATGGIGSLVGLAAGGGGGIPGFASGGLVFGPTLSLIGEGSGTTRSNPEVVAPLDQLRGLIGSGQAVQVVVSGRLRGTDMLLQDNRTNRSNGRLGA